MSANSKIISSKLFIYASLHLLGCYNLSCVNVGLMIFFFFLSVLACGSYLCGTFISNKNTVCFKEEQPGMGGNTNINKCIYTCEYKVPAQNVMKLLIKVCMLLNLRKYDF